MTLTAATPAPPAAPRHFGIAASGAIGFAGALLGSLLGFGLIAVVGRGLGVDDTGTFFQVVGWFMIAVALFRFGADTGLLRTWAVQVGSARAPDLRQTLWVALVPVAVVSTAAAVAVQFLAPWLAGAMGAGDAADAERMVAVLGWCLPPAVLFAVLLNGLRGLGSVVAFTVLQNIALPTMRIALALVVVVIGLGALPGLLVSWAAPLPALLIVAGVLTARRLHAVSEAPVASASTPEVSTLSAGLRFWSFSAARGVAAFLEVLLEWIDVLVVAALRSPAEAGVYAVATRLVRAGLVVDSAVRVAVAPRIATLLAAGDRAAAGVLFTAMARVVILVAWPVYLVLAVFGETVLGWFGEGFGDGSTLLAVLSVAMMIALAAGIVQSLLLMGGRSHYQMANKAVAVTVNVALNLALVPDHGITGAAVAWVVTLLVDTLLASLQVRFRMGVDLDLRTLVLPASLTIGIFGGGCALAYLVLGGGALTLLVALVACGLVHLSVLWWLRERLGLRQFLSL